MTEPATASSACVRDGSPELRQDRVGNEQLLAGSICKRCSTVPWVDLSQLASDVVLFKIEETVGKWDTSTCRICQILVKALPVGYPSDSSPELSWGPPRAGIHGFGSLHLPSAWSSKGRLLLPRPLDVTCVSPQDAQVQLRKWHTKNLDLTLVKSWIRNCEQSHRSCEPSLQSSLHNLRVIDCPHLTVVQAPWNCSFVALSYVWGSSSQPEMPATVTLDQDLPRTIQDSMVITQKLGYRYLWVDRLVCVRWGTIRLRLTI